MESYQPEFFRILFEGRVLSEFYFSIAQYVSRQPSFPLDTSELQILFRPDHRKGFHAVDSEEFRKCVVASVEHIYEPGSWNDGHTFGHARRSCDVVEGGDMRFQIVKRVCLEAAFSLNFAQRSR